MAEAGLALDKIPSRAKVSLLPASDLPEIIQQVPITPLGQELCGCSQIPGGMENPNLESPHLQGTASGKLREGSSHQSFMRFGHKVLLLALRRSTGAFSCKRGHPYHSPRVSYYLCAKHTPSLAPDLLFLFLS